MDPNEALFVARQAAERIIYAVDDCEPIDDDDSIRLAEAFNNIHDWIHKGGVLPNIWRIAQEKNFK
jgi:hypothetical protein